MPHFTGGGFRTVAGVVRDVGWATQTITDWLTQPTVFVTGPDGQTGSTIETEVTNSEAHTSTYVTDGYSRAVQITNAKSQNAKFSWDTDNNMTRLERTTAPSPPGSTIPRPATRWRRRTRRPTRRSLEGRTWQFGYHTRGNLKTVTDAKGVATMTAGDYTTAYEYDAYGQLAKATDVNGNASVNSDFGPTGYPRQCPAPPW